MTAPITFGARKSHLSRPAPTRGPAPSASLAVLGRILRRSPSTNTLGGLVLGSVSSACPKNPSWVYTTRAVSFSSDSDDRFEEARMRSWMLRALANVCLPYVVATKQMA